MKSEPNENINPTGDHRDCEPRGGLTKREYFAAMAMQGLLANARIAENMGKYEDQISQAKQVVIAKMAITNADALINELNK